MDHGYSKTQGNQDTRCPNWWDTLVKSSAGCYLGFPMASGFNAIWEEVGHRGLPPLVITH